MNSNDAGNDAPRKRPIIMDRLRHNIRNDVNINEPRPPPKQRSVSRARGCTVSLPLLLVSSFISFVKNHISFYTHLRSDTHSFVQ